QKTEHRLSGHSSHKAPLMIQPLRVALFRYAVADEGQARRTERNELMSIDRQIARILAPKRRFGGTVLNKVSCHPVVFARGSQVLNRFTPVAAMQLRSALTR